MSNLTHYLCPLCKSAFIKLSDEKSLSCPYCGSEAGSYTPADDSGMPEFIIPFKVSRLDAAKRFSEIAKTVPFLPKEYKTLDAATFLDGFYIPFWLFDGRCNAKLTYHAQKVHNFRNPYGMPYSYFESFKVDREGDVNFEDIPVDASLQADNAYTEALEPYDSSEIVPFREEHLKEFFAEKANVSREEAESRANERLHHTLEKDFSEDMSDFENVSKDDAVYGLSHKNSDCNLMPVWMMSLNYNGSVYRYAVNGQTGKVVGEIPISIKMRNLFFIKAFLLTLIPTAAITFIAYFILSLFGKTFENPELFISFILVAVPWISALIATAKKLYAPKKPSGNDFAEGYVDKSDYKLIKKKKHYVYTELSALPIVQRRYQFLTRYFRQ